MLRRETPYLGAACGVGPDVRADFLSFLPNSDKLPKDSSTLHVSVSCVSAKRVEGGSVRHRQSVESESPYGKFRWNCLKSIFPTFCLKFRAEYSETSAQTARAQTVHNRPKPPPTIVPRHTPPTVSRGATLALAPAHVKTRRWRVASQSLCTPAPAHILRESATTGATRRLLVPVLCAADETSLCNGGTVFSWSYLHKCIDNNNNAIMYSAKLELHTSTISPVYGGRLFLVGGAPEGSVSSAQLLAPAYLRTQFRRFDGSGPRTSRLVSCRRWGGAGGGSPELHTCPLPRRSGTSGI